ncbi:MAG: GntR family transcriptional regulator [Betaproteobacteria bacterium]|nr:GntR family transcriptional regulator [Betaproteobacteria bacterium]
MINKSSLCQQAVDLLKKRIISHALAPGQRLDEAALAMDLGISRTPLREALKILSAEGFVHIKPRRGCFVAELTPGDLEEIFPIMAMLEGRVAHEVAIKATADDLKRLAALHEKLEKHAAGHDVDRYYEVNYVFHDALQELAGNRWLQHMIGDLRRLLRLSRHRSLKLEGRQQESLAEHRALMDALRRRDAAAAEEIMKNHLLAQLVALRSMAARQEAA